MILNPVIEISSGPIGTVPCHQPIAITPSLAHSQLFSRLLVTIDHHKLPLSVRYRFIGIKPRYSRHHHSRDLMDLYRHQLLQRHQR